MATFDDRATNHRLLDFQTLEDINDPKNLCDCSGQSDTYWFSACIWLENNRKKTLNIREKKSAFKILSLYMKTKTQKTTSLLCL